MAWHPFHRLQDPFVCDSTASYLELHHPLTVGGEGLRGQLFSANHAATVSVSR